MSTSYVCWCNCMGVPLTTADVVVVYCLHLWNPCRVWSFGVAVSYINQLLREFQSSPALLFVCDAGFCLHWKDEFRHYSVCRQVGVVMTMTHCLMTVHLDLSNVMITFNSIMVSSMHFLVLMSTAWRLSVFDGQIYLYHKKKQQPNRGMLILYNNCYHFQRKEWGKQWNSDKNGQSPCCFHDLPVFCSPPS